jgi:hypothetical protein
MWSGELLASSLKLLAVGTVTLGIILLAVAAVGLGGAAVGRARALGGAVSTRAS